MTFSNDRIRFPVSDTRPFINNSRTFLNADSIGDFAPTVIGSVAFLTPLLTTQKSMQFTAILLIRIRILVNPFMTHGSMTFQPQPFTNLIR